MLSSHGRGWPNSGPWPYRILSEPVLSQELERSAQVMTHADGRVDSVSFQPCLNPEEASQDRRVAEEWSLPSGKWTFAAVFDGEFVEMFI